MHRAARAEVRRLAEDRDAQLAMTQRTARERAMREVRIGPDGRVSGILLRWKKGKSGRRAPLFQVGITSLLSGKVVNTTVSIKRHGLNEAWRRAVEFYARHRRIPEGSQAHLELLRARPEPTVLKRAPAAAAGRVKRTADRGRAPARAPRQG